MFCPILVIVNWSN